MDGVSASFLRLLMRYAIRDMVMLRWDEMSSDLRYSLRQTVS